MAGPFTAGQRVTAAQLDSFCAPQCVIKPGDTSRSSTTVLANDPDLFLPVVANATYEFRAYIDYEGGTTGSSDLKFAWTFPAGATLRHNPHYLAPAAGLAQEGGVVFTGGTIATGTNGAGVSFAADMTGSLIVAGTAGNLQLQWAQNTSSATATKVHLQSYVMLWRIT